MKALKIFAVLIVLASLLGCVRAVVTANRMITNGFDTIYNQFKPEELLRKYEWFKDASAQLDAKQADISLGKQKMDMLAKSYGTEPRSKWTRTDAEQYNLWSSETGGIAMSYNELAAQYNADMAKFNYGFCNAGTMPAGAAYDKVLPREYKPYATSF